MVKFDHIIHFVNQLDSVGTEGVLPIHSGGKHEPLGTANLLSYFDQRYVEYLAIDDEERFRRHLEAAEDSFAKTIDQVQYEEGFIRCALATEEIHQLADRYRAKGFRTVGPVDMERTTKGGRPSGGNCSISWMMRRPSPSSSNGRKRNRHAWTGSETYGGSLFPRK